MVDQAKERRREREKEYGQRPEVKEMRRAAFKKYASQNREKLLVKAAERRLLKRASCLVATTRTRARKRNLEFDLDQHVADIQSRIDKGVCELTGFPFDLSPGRKFNSPSLDRIDLSTTIYTLKNDFRDFDQIVCFVDHHIGQIAVDDRKRIAVRSFELIKQQFRQRSCVMTGVTITANPFRTDRTGEAR